MTYPSKYKDAQVEILGEVGAAKRISTSNASVTVALTSTTRRVSIKAVTSSIKVSDPKINPPRVES